MRPYQYLLVVICLGAFVALPATAFTANTLSITVAGNGDATVMFSYYLTLTERTAVYMKIANPAVELEKALESNFGKEVTVKSVTTSSAQFTVKEFATVETAGTKVTLTTPEIDLSKAQDAVKDQWYAKYLKIDFTPAKTTITFPDKWIKSFSGVSLIPSVTHTVTSPPPTVTSILPVSGKAGTTVAITSLKGTNFVQGATVSLTRTGQPALPATDVVVVSPTTITCTFALPANAATGYWNVRVVNPDGQAGTKTSAFTVASSGSTAPVPTVTSILPTSGKAGTSVAITSLKGTNFVQGATVALTRTGQTAIQATDVVVVSSSTITCTFALPANAVTGYWSVRVVNPDGKSATKSSAFTIATSGTTPTITVTSISPTSGRAGTTLTISSLRGTGFLQGATAAITYQGTAIPLTSMNVLSSSLIYGRVTIPATATKGYWDVVVTNPGGQSATKTRGFQVT